MNDWQRIEDVFVAAVELPLNERSLFLDSECAGDAGLRGEVESLLAFDGANTRPFAQVVAKGAAGLLSAEALVGQRIGAYRITDALGHGGMGEVYLAVRADDQFSKKVAMKFIRRGMDSPAVVQRFLRERQILANLDHPYIAKLLDGGATMDGVPYFVMEYVAGTPVDEYCARANMGVAKICEIFRRICEAVGCAHRNLIVHRDLKPTNILVTAEGTPVLLDFGIAKLIDESLATDRNHTAGTWILTPDYASPEQIRGLPTTTATDVYSLGVVFYQLLTGVRPWSADSTTPLQFARTVCEQQPPRPSELAPSRKLKGDLDNIVLMALRKEPERRYATVEQFSEDIRRYLAGLPVIAREDTFYYRTRKFVQRNRVAVPAALVTAACLIAATVVTAHEASRAEQARRIAEAQKDRAEAEHKTADRERDVAARASAIAIQKAGEAEAQRAKAENRMRDLVELGRQSLYEVQGTLEHVPGALQARRDVIVTTLQYLDGIGAQSKDDPQVLSLLTAGYTQTGDVLGFPNRANLGDAKGALDAWRKARFYVTTLEKLQPGQMDGLLQDLGLHQRVGMLLQSQDDLAGAGREFSAALEIAHRLARDHPRDWLAVVQTGIIEHNLAAAAAVRDKELAREHTRREIAAYEKAVALNPNGDELPLGLSSAYSSFGRLLVGERNFEEGLKLMRRALEIREKQLALHPNDAMYRASIARSWLRIAAATGAPWEPNTGDRAAAMEPMEKALGMYESLSAVDPADRRAQGDLANALVYAGAIGEDASKSLPRLRRAVSILTELRASDPKHASYGEDLARAHEYIGQFLQEAGDVPGAMAEYRQSVDVRPNAALSAKIGATWR